MKAEAEIAPFGAKTFEKINWNHVFYFTVVASTGSMRAAAKFLDLRPSTLSEQISTLEETLKVKLFSRKLKRLVLTDEGQKLYRYSKSMFDTGQRLLDVISPSSVGMYPVTIGLVPAATIKPIFEMIVKFSGQQFDNRVRVNRSTHEELESNLLEAKVDFGFTDRKSERKDIVQTLIFKGKIRFFGAEEYTRMPFDSALHSTTLFICRSGNSQLSTIETILDQMEIRPKTIVSSEYVSLVFRAAEMGAGIAALSEEFFASEQTTLKQLTPPTGFPEISEQFYLSWAAGSENSSSIKSLKTFLQSNLKLV